MLGHDRGAQHMESSVTKPPNDAIDQGYALVLMVILSVQGIGFLIGVVCIVFGAWR